MSHPHTGEQFTQFGWFVCLWILLIPFQYGYHISVLNQIQAVLTCKDGSPDTRHYLYGLPTCLPMSDFTFSVVTAVFTVGGLGGSMVANVVMDRWGRRGAARASSILVAVGAGLMCVGASVGILGLGRFLVGVGAGIGLCVGPIYLSEIAPSKISGNVGVLTQLGIVLGIMITQAIGLRFATPTQWRSVLFLSAAASVVQFFLSSVMVESPVWLAGKGKIEPRKVAAHKLWGVAAPATLSGASVEDPLLDNLEAHRDENVAALTVPQVIAAPDIRKPLAIVCFAMLSQQLSGTVVAHSFYLISQWFIVLYYSNDILSKSLPELGPYVSLGITVVNVLMTFPPIILIERVGRRRLLFVSTFGAISSLVLVGLGLNIGAVTLSSVAILTFVTSFAIGLGPVPFVLIPEVSPHHAVSALSSIALSLNWTANFLVGLVFLPLRNFLADGEATKEGRVFYVFAVALFCSMVQQTFAQTAAIESVPE
ncbi:general substrate transporter, partial [Mycena pura]